MVERDVEIKTPDGTCDAAFIHPKSGSHPGVLIWPDAFGLRPSMREMAKRFEFEKAAKLRDRIKELRTKEFLFA